MDLRDAKMILKAIQKAQDTPGDLFTQRSALTLTKDEEDAVKQAKLAIESGEIIAYMTGCKLLSIYERAYKYCLTEVYNEPPSRAV